MIFSMKPMLTILSNGKFTTELLRELFHKATVNQIIISKTGETNRQFFNGSFPKPNILNHAPMLLAYKEI